MKYEIGKNPWNYDYAPLSEAELTRDSEAFYVTLRSYEEKIRFVNEGRNKPVYQDSCLEFFFSPCTGSLRPYMNFEINPVGSLYTGFSPDGTRAASSPVADEVPLSYFEIKSMNREEAENYKGPFWEVSYRIPFEFLNRFFPDTDFADIKEITANFYKCGDLTDNVHFLAWSDIKTPEPDFHRPEFFGHVSL